MVTNSGDSMKDPGQIHLSMEGIVRYENTQRLELEDLMCQRGRGVGMGKRE
jgi:hypothetical protein